MKRTHFEALTRKSQDEVTEIIHELRELDMNGRTDKLATLEAEGKVRSWVAGVRPEDCTFDFIGRRRPGLMAVTDEKFDEIIKKLGAGRVG